MPPRGACDAAASSPTGTAESTNSRSPQITGDDEPRPGISTFQRMLVVSLPWLLAVHGTAMVGAVDRLARQLSGS